MLPLNAIAIVLLNSVAFCSALYLNSEADAFYLELRMPDVISSKPDDLICYTHKLNTSSHQYILAYNPKADSKIAHHMMVYGCKEPGSTLKSWKCGGEERSEEDVCDGGSMGKRIAYAWALDAPSKVLPEGVGLRVGGDTDIKYLVLQLHYKKKFEEGQSDQSGVQLKMTYKKQLKQMGFYILGNWGVIPPHQTAFHLESACTWYRNDTIFPFAYRTHSHQLGRVTSGYRIREGVWTEIGRMSPQQPEMFYEVTNKGIDIRYGDVLAARCTMNSIRRTENTALGATNADEMCNFYFMYATDKSENLNDEYCFNDAQSFHWNQYLKDEPETASTLVGVHLVAPSMEPHDQVNM